MLLTLAAFAALAPQGPGPSTAPVVINEFSYDDTGVDDKEFVELYNRTNAPINLGGWIVRCVEGTSPGGTNTTFTIPATVTIAPGGYVVVGTSLVPNVTPGCVAAVNFLENTTGPDGITLEDPSGNVVDSVLWCYALWTAPTPAYLEGTGLWGRHFMTDAAPVTNFCSVQRRVDGWDSNDNGADFVYMTWTPGTANGSQNTLATPYVRLCDGTPGSDLGADFAASFRVPVIADPSAITNATSSTISVPASPQGGNIAVINDPTGGGCASYLRVPVGDDFLVECYVYVKGGSPAIGATEGEAWGIGVGTTDSYASPVDASGTYYATTTACTGVGNREPGATGLAWFGYNTAVDTRVFLVDMNNGGPGFTVLAGPIVCTPGTNDGWQRLRLRVNGLNFRANFGGTFGCNDGQAFSGTLARAVSGQVYFQFRECIITNANMTPLLLDRVEVWGVVNFSTTFGGAASPTNFGTPSIGTSGGDPVVGNTGFGIAGTGLVPGGISGLLLGLGTLDPGFPVPGAPGTVAIYVNPLLASNLVLNDGFGNGAFALGIPCDNSIVGLPITSQFVDFDPTLAFPVPIGTSQGMQLLVGN